jgi:hypothetical protein
MASIRTLRLTKEEQRILAKRSKRAGMRKATFVQEGPRGLAVFCWFPLLGMVLGGSP